MFVGVAMERKDCLFLGNGINRCFGADGWKTVLNAINNEIGVGVDIKRSNIGYLLIYELFYCYLSNENDSSPAEKIVGIIKKEVGVPADQKEALQNYCKKLFDGRYEAVLTTNYDYEIENQLCELKRSENPHDEQKIDIKPYHKKETKCSTIRYNLVNDVKVYHIHGELDMVKTICMGYVKYTDNLTKLASRTGFDKVYDEGNTIVSVIDDFLYRAQGSDKDCWVKYFFLNDVHILGFGLSKDELDVWWVIFLRYKYMKAGGSYLNKIYYYDCGDSGLEDILETLDVHYVKLKEETDNDYLRPYEYFLEFRDQPSK